MLEFSDEEIKNYKENDIFFKILFNQKDEVVRLINDEFKTNFKTKGRSLPKWGKIGKFISQKGRFCIPQNTILAIFYYQGTFFHIFDALRY